jgi:hypothetical protein
LLFGSICCVKSLRGVCLFYFYLWLCEIWTKKRKEEKGGAKKIKALLRQK